MRTTITLDPDIAAAVERLRGEAGIGLSEAVNRLARAGLVVELDKTYHVEIPSRSMSARLDYTNISDTLALLDEAD